MKKTFKKISLSFLAILVTSFLCEAAFTNSNSRKSIKSLLATDSSSIVINSLFGQKISNDNVTITESQFNYLISNLDNLDGVIDYSVVDTSTVSFDFIHNSDVLIFNEHTLGGSIFTKNIAITVSSPFVDSNIKPDIYSNSFSWDKAADSFVRNDSNQLYWYSQLTENGMLVENCDFYTSFDLRLDDLYRYGEFQITVTEKESKEMRLVFKADDIDTVIVFTDQRDNSLFEAKKICKKVTNYQGEVMHCEILYHQDIVTYVLDGEVVDSCSLGTMSNHLLFGAGDITAYVKNISTTFDMETIKAKHNQIVNSNVYGVDTTLVGRGNPEMFNVTNSSIDLDLSGQSERVFATPTVNKHRVKGEQFIFSGIAKIDKTADTSLGKAGKIEFQVYTANVDYIKFIIYRYTDESTSTFNNSFYVEGNNSIKSESIPLTKIKDNCFPIGAGPNHYTAIKYEIVYDNGMIYFFINKTMFYQYDSNWNAASIALGVNGYANVSWQKTSFVNDHVLIKNRLEQLSPFSENHTFGVNSFTSEGVDDAFKKDDSGYFIKDEYSYQKSFLYNSNNNPISGNSYYAYFTLFNNYANDWGQSEILVEGDSTHAYRFVLEKTSAGTYQVFKENKNGTNWWANYETIIKSEIKSTNHYTFGILVFDNQLYFIIDGYVRSIYPIEYQSHLGFGGQQTTSKLKNITSELDVNKVELEKDSLEMYVAKSKYESRIQKYEDYYADYPNGGLLLMGSSSLDYWNTFKEDLSDVEIVYNCGIGGTGISDWQDYMMERLVYRHSPSTILMFLGGNEIGVLSVSKIVNKIRETLLDIHERLPETRIYLLGQKPAIVSRKTFEKYQELNEGQQEIASDYSDFIQYIDNWDYYMDSNGNPIRSYFVDDGMHLTTEGYVVWKNVIRKGLGLD